MSYPVFVFFKYFIWNRNILICWKWYLINMCYGFEIYSKMVMFFTNLEWRNSKSVFHINFWKEIILNSAKYTCMETCNNLIFTIECRCPLSPYLFTVETKVEIQLALEYCNQWVNSDFINNLHYLAYYLLIK